MTLSESKKPKPRIACVFVTGIEAASKTPSPSGGTDPLHRLAEASLRFSPQVALREGEAIFIEIGGSRHLYSEEGFRHRMRALCARFGIQARITIAGTAALALAEARHGTNELSRLPLEALDDFLDPFLTETPPEREVSARRLRDWIRKLHDLGIHSPDSFIRLPVRALTGRFGIEASWLSRRIQSREDPPWPRFTPPARIQEQEGLLNPETMESEAFSLEAALFSLKRLCDRLTSRLRARGLRAAGMEIIFRMERGRDRKWEIQLPFPQGSSSGLIPILRDRLGFELDREPLRAAIEAIEIAIVETAPGHGSQTDLFRREELDAEAMDSLLGRLSSRLGEGSAFRAQAVDRHLPEGAWMPCLDSGGRAGSTPGREHVGVPRPSRLLPEPEPVLREGSRIISQLRRKQWRVREWSGPERLSGEWWQGANLNEGFERDYFRVSTESGETLWVYRTPDSRLYLHGYFD